MTDRDALNVHGESAVNPKRRKRDLHPFTGMTRRWFCRVEWKVQDAWIGVFWKRDYPWRLDVWVCIVPMVPLHFGWDAQVEHG